MVARAARASRLLLRQREGEIARGNKPPGPSIHFHGDWHQVDPDPAADEAQPSADRDDDATKASASASMAPPRFCDRSEDDEIERSRPWPPPPAGTDDDVPTATLAWSPGRLLPLPLPLPLTLPLPLPLPPLSPPVSAAEARAVVDEYRPPACIEAEALKLWEIQRSGEDESA